MNKEIQQQLAAHGIPEGILSVWNRKKTSSRLQYFSFGPPNLELVDDLRGRVAGLRDLVPIFDRNGDAAIGFLPSSEQFIQFYYEDLDRGDEEIGVLGTGYQQFACRLLIENEESGLQEFYDDLVTELQFKSGKRLRELLDADPYDDDAVEEFCEQLSTAER